MRIVLVIKSMTGVGGGAERNLRDLAAHLQGAGHACVLVTFDAPQAPAFYTLPDGIPVHQLGIGSTDRRSTLTDLRRRTMALRRLLSRLEPDVAIGFMHSSYVPLTTAAKLAHIRLPVIASERSTSQNYGRMAPERALMYLAWMLADSVTVLSASARDSFPVRLRHRLHPIYNPVLPSSVRAKTANGSLSRRTVVSVGALSTRKDHASLIRGFALVAAANPEWDLRIVGDGPIKKDLQGLVVDLDLEDRVSFTGGVRDVGAELSLAHIYVMPSRYEGFGMATAEALAAGLPCLGFADCPGTNELIIDGVNGILVEPTPSRVHALAVALSSLMTDEPLREALASEAAKTVRRFRPEIIYPQWSALISKLAD